MNDHKLGVGVIVVRRDEILFGLRRGAHGAGMWSCPGGNLDAGESAETCALRELYEETGLNGLNPRVVAETKDDFPEGLRYRTLVVRVDWTGGEPELREPEACARWGWFAWDDPPQPLFLPIANLRVTGFRPVTCSERAHRSGLLVLEISSQLPTPATGVVEEIHIAPAAAAPTRPLDVVRARAGIGLEGDRYAAGRGHFSHDHRVSRDLTLIEAEVIESLARDHGIELAPGEARRNITTRGIRLNDLLGRRFWVGEVLCAGTRLCEPCQYLADLTGKALLRPLVHRGGLRADILRGGFIRRGDRLRVVDKLVAGGGDADHSGSRM
jgi:MOSC domain-containing protein YiiM/ADP-ribose pyrophosphatase YjhB (NUDIX family)